MAYVDEIGWGPDLGWPKKVMVKAPDEHNVYYRANVIAVNRKKGTVRLEYTAAAGYKDMQFALNIDSDRIWRYTCNANWWEKLFPDGRGNKQCKFSGGWRPKPGAAKYPYSPLALHQQHKAAVKGAVASPTAQRAQKQGRGQQQQPAPQQQQQQQQSEAKAGTPGSAEKLRGMSRLETFLTFGRRNQAGRRRWRQASADSSSSSSSSSSEDDSDSEVTGSPGSSDAAADVGPGGTSTQQQAGHEVYTAAVAEPAARQLNTQGAEAGSPDARVHSDSLQTAAAATVVTPHRKRKAVAGDNTAAVDAGMSKRARDSSHTGQSTPSAALDTAAEPAVAGDASCSLVVSKAQHYLPPKQLVQQNEQQADKVLGDLTALNSMQQPSPAAAAIVEQGELTRAEGPHKGQVVEQTAHVAAVHTSTSAPATAAAADVVPGQALLQSPQLLPDQQQQVSDREPNIRDADAPMTPVDNSAAVHNAQTEAAVQAAGHHEQSLRSQQRGLMVSGAQSLLEAEGRTPAFAARPPELLQMQRVQDGAKNSLTNTAVHIAAGEADAAAAADMAEDPAEVAGPTDPGTSGVKLSDVTQEQQPAEGAAAAAGTRQDNVAVPAAPAAAAVAQVDTAEPAPSPQSPALHRSHRQQQQQQQQQHGGALNSPTTSPPSSSPTGAAATAASASLGHLRLPGDFSLCVLSDAADGCQWVLVDKLMRYAMITPDCLITSAKDFNQVLADFTAAGSSSSSSGVKVTTAQQLRQLVSAGVVKRGSRGMKLMSLGMTAALLEHLDLTEAAVAVLTTQPEMAVQSPTAANAAAAGGGHIHNPAVGGSPHGANRTVELAVPGAAGAGLAEQAAAVQTRVEANANGVCIDLTDD